MKYAVFCLADPDMRYMKTYYTPDKYFSFATLRKQSLTVQHSFHISMISSDFLYFSDVFNRTARSTTTKRFATYNPITGLTIIPDDPITITDFKLDHELVKALDRRGSQPIINRKIAFMAPANHPNNNRVRGKREDTPYPHSALPHNHYPNSRYPQSGGPVVSSSSTTRMT